MALLFHTEPVATFDLDVSGSGGIDLERLAAILERHGLTTAWNRIRSQR